MLMDADVVSCSRLHHPPVLRALPPHLTSSPPPLPQSPRWRPVMTALLNELSPLPGSAGLLRQPWFPSAVIHPPAFCSCSSLMGLDCSCFHGRQCLPVITNRLVPIIHGPGYELCHVGTLLLLPTVSLNLISPIMCGHLVKEAGTRTREAQTFSRQRPNLQQIAVTQLGRRVIISLFPWRPDRDDEEVSWGASIWDSDG